MAAASDDPLSAALNPLVVAGELTADQAVRVDAALRRLVPAAAASAIPAAASPSRPSQRLLAAVVVAGAGLLGAGALVAAGLDSDRPGAKAFTVSFGCGLALLTAAVLVWTIARDAAGRRLMASVLGSIGVVTLLAVASLARIGDYAVANYVTGSALLALGVAGYALLGGTVCTVVGSLGVLLVFGQAYSDSNSTGPDASSLLGFGVVLMIIGIVIAQWAGRSAAATSLA